METTTTTTHAKNATTKKDIDAIGEQVHHVETALQERVEQARDIVEEVRDRVEMAIQERPYLVPVAAGALGLGVGVLIGSKLSRMIALGVAGALLSDTVRGQLVAMSKELLNDLGQKLDAGEDIEEPASM